MIAIDQFGTIYPVDPKRRRASLCERLGRKHADRIYRDKRDGSTVHVGWAIGGHWLTLYEEVEAPV